MTQRKGEAMRDGSEEEYVDYVTMRIPALRRLAYLLAGDAHRADDLVQQTITTLYVKWRRAQAADHLDAYVRTMLVRTFVDERRLAWARVRLFREAPEPPPFSDDGVEDRQVLRAALSRVPRRQQAVLVLRFFYDLSVDEVAGMLGCSAGTVKSQTSRGLATLRRLLGEREFAGYSPVKLRSR
jgi:RNA polymerase sigma-70 factor (sigma-E family)